MLRSAQLDWWLDKLGSPVAPLEWFKRLPASGSVGWLLGVIKCVMVVVWAVGFIWLWFTVFVLAFALEYTLLAKRPKPAETSSPPPSARHSV